MCHHLAIRTPTKSTEDFSDNGRVWLDKDVLWSQWGKLLEGFEFCHTIFRNSEGNPDKKNEYIIVRDPDVWFLPFSQLD